MEINNGTVMSRSVAAREGRWPGLDQLGYWSLYPALLVVTIVNAGFSSTR
jgi:malonate transporter